jgi:hypothetical protein
MHSRKGGNKCDAFLQVCCAGPRTDRMRTEYGPRTDRPTGPRLGPRTPTGNGPATDNRPKTDRNRTENGPRTDRPVRSSVRGSRPGTDRAMDNGPKMDQKRTENGPRTDRTTLEKYLFSGQRGVKSTSRPSVARGTPPAGRAQNLRPRNVRKRLGGRVTPPHFATHLTSVSALPNCIENSRFTTYS